MRRRIATCLVLALLSAARATAQEADAETRAADVRTLQAAGVGTDGQGLIDFFKSRSPDPADRERVPLRVKQLGDEDFDVRERASADLVRIGVPAVGALKAAATDRDAEVARRAAECLARIAQRKQDAGGLAAVAARLLADRKPAGAAGVLFDFLRTADPAEDTWEAERALAAVAARDGKPEPALVVALAAKEPRLRALAGAALAGVDADAVRPLLRDADPAVRLRVGLALAEARDKAAVPVLIDLLGTLPAEQAWRAEALLQRLAGEKSPAVGLGTDDAGREKCRDAWAGWWRDQGGKADLAALAQQRPHLGYRLIVTPDGGTVEEIDRDGQRRWRVTGLKSAFFAEVLPGNRVLVAEYSGQVTERNLQGEVLWQKAVQLPVQCQRLPGGGTLIATTRQVIEIDPAGKESELFENNGPGKSLIAARKKPNGHLVVMLSDGTCRTLDAAGKEVARFAAGRISNNCMEVQPNGNVLVAKFFDGRVTEYDPKGNAVWDVAVQSAFAPSRLPNGNTLVACHEPARVVEVDRAGTIVREHKAESPNHRPWFTSSR